MIRPAVLAIATLAAVQAHGQADTPEARELLRQAIAETFRMVDCEADLSTDLAVDAFFARMDTIAEAKFRTAGLTFPETMEDRDAAFLPVYEKLFEDGVITESRDGDVELFPSACEGG